MKLGGKIKDKGYSNGFVELCIYTAYDTLSHRRLSHSYFLTNKQLKSIYSQLLLEHITRGLYFLVQAQKTIVRSSIESQIIIVK